MLNTKLTSLTTKSVVVRFVISPSLAARVSSPNSIDQLELALVVSVWPELTSRKPKLKTK